MKVKTGKYLGSKQVYTLTDFFQYWRDFGFLAAIKELRKREEKYWFLGNK